MATTGASLKAGAHAGPQAAHARGLVAGAFGAVYREHYGAIAGMIYRRTGDAHLTEDLTSEVFVAAFLARASYRGEVPVLAWLRRIGQNRVTRWQRREAGLRGILRRLVMRELEKPVPAPELSDELRTLHSLPASQQTLLSLHYLEGLSLAEVGFTLGLGEQAVKSRLARAREAFRKQLEQEPLEKGKTHERRRF